MCSLITPASVRTTSITVAPLDMTDVRELVEEYGFVYETSNGWIKIAQDGNPELADVWRVRSASSLDIRQNADGSYLLVIDSQGSEVVESRYYSLVELDAVREFLSAFVSLDGE